MNDQEILFALNVHEALNKKEKKRKFHIGINSTNGEVAYLSFKQKFKKKKLSLKANDLEETLIPPKDLKQKKKPQQIKYLLANVELKEQKE